MTIERRDMDERAARIVEALYGERDPAELDPQDRSEVDSYSQLRAMFRSLPDEEPPSAVSAKLLSAAASSAPASRAAEESAGAWAWVRDLFRPIMNHPGLAAAASLVLVVGVAATLYVTRKVDVEGPTVSSESAQKAEPPATPEDSDEAPVAATPPAAEAEPSREAAATGAGDQPDDLGTVRPGRVEPKAGNYAQPAGDPSMPPELAKEQEAAVDEKRRDRRMSRTGDKRDDAARVLRAEARAKEIVDSTARLDEGTVTRGGSRGSGGQAGPAAKPAKPAAPAPEPTADAEGGEAEAPRQQAEPAPPPPPQEEQADSDKAEAPAKTKQKKSVGNPQAVRLHGQAADAAAKGDCKTAMALGSKIRSLDSSYYKDVFLGDSRVRKCRTPAKK